MPEMTFSMFAPSHARTLQPGLGFPAEPKKPPKALTEKYRPQWFHEIVGQGAAVLRMMDFADAPYSSAWIFSGYTGTGKTSLALALARELGACEFGGLDVIKSGAQDAEAVTKALNELRYVPMMGSGWKVVIVDEADSMSPKARMIWLSALEDLPPKSVVIFTTNHLDKFETRFLDRCKHLRFQSDRDLLLLDAQALFASVWHAEKIPGQPFSVELIPNLFDNGSLSFRRVVQAIDDVKFGWRPSTQAPPTQAVPTPPVKPAARRRASA